MTIYDTTKKGGYVDKHMWIWEKKVMIHSSQVNDTVTQSVNFQLLDESKGLELLLIFYWNNN